MRFYQNLDFLKQTALDYDLPLRKVKRIYENHGGLDFYEALEKEKEFKKKLEV